MSRKSDDNNSNNSVVAVRRDDSGNISELKLSSGNVVQINEAINMAKNGDLPGYNVGRTRGDNPHDILRGNADGDSSNNLDNLPTF